VGSGACSTNSTQKDIEEEISKKAYITRQQQYGKQHDMAAMQAGRKRRLHATPDSSSK
jgi:hypothetical protein